MTVDETIRLLKERGAELAQPIAVGKNEPMRFSCTFSNEAVSFSEVANLFVPIPADLAEFWSIARSARLFEDMQYGQWGLSILEPRDAQSESRQYSALHRRDAEEGDLVIARFIGDWDLLLARCDRSSDDFGEILVAEPIVKRADWFRPATSFGSFLERYALAGGDKYWEKTRNVGST